MGPSQGALIDMPYFAQTPLLCGGAALAMVLRYWGAPSVVPDDFQHLVDEAAGGIATGRLVEAARERGWQSLASSAPSSGSIDAIARHVRQGRPVVALVEDRPGVNHYVVVVGVTTSDVVVHDPARAPYRVLTHDDFDERWQTSGRWMLLVLPGDNTGAPGAAAVSTRSGAATTGPESPTTSTADAGPCDALVAQGVATAGVDQATAERMLRSAVALCPQHAAGYRELAGLRLVQQRWDESITFAEQAITRAPGDRNAWQVLATSRFVAGERIAALRAWNAVGEPTLDMVTVDGLRRTPQPVVAGLAGLRAGQRLTADGFTRAVRRLEELPSASRSSLSYTPLSGGRASVAAVVNERSLLPSGWIGWTSVTTHALITRNIRVDIAAPFSQGDLWQPSFRWPRARRRVGLDVALPVPGGWRGLIHLEAFWERQTYARFNDETMSSEETRRRIGMRYSDWLTGNVRLELGAAVDRIDGVRHVALQAETTTRFWRDHLAGHLRAEQWIGTGGGASGHSAVDAAFDWRSTIDADRPGWTTRVGAALASAAAPLALWPGAGSTFDRTALLRARPLVRRHIVSGEVLGRRLAFVSAERRHPVWRSPYGAVAVAGFLDAAKAWDRLDGAPDSRLHVDAGVGLRLERPGDASQIRVDVGVGLRDGRMRASAGYVTSWGRR